MKITVGRYLKVPVAWHPAWAVIATLRWYSLLLQLPPLLLQGHKRCLAVNTSALIKRADRRRREEAGRRLGRQAGREGGRRTQCKRHRQPHYGMLQRQVRADRWGSRRSVGGHTGWNSHPGRGPHHQPDRGEGRTPTWTSHPLQSGGDSGRVEGAAEGQDQGESWAEQLPQWRQRCQLSRTFLFLLSCFLFHLYYHCRFWGKRFWSVAVWMCDQRVARSGRLESGYK